jgi:hypothetical protein
LNLLIVQACVRHRLETLHGRLTEVADYSIRETPDTDYRCRIIVPKARWQFRRRDGGWALESATICTARMSRLCDLQAEQQQ